jgi:outer membrane protein assembly factor BamB
MAARAEMIFVGIKGSVIGIERSTGATKWTTNLVGSDFVNVTTMDGDLFASSRGRLYRLDPASGDITWCNELPGMGWGLMTIASASQTAPSAEKKRRDDAAAAAGTAASS